MKYFQLIAALLPIFEEVFSAIQSTLAAGKTPDQIHAAIVDHVAALPAAVRSV